MTTATALYPEYASCKNRFSDMGPSHWSEKALWKMARVRNEKNPGGLKLLSVFLDRGVIPYDEGGGQVHPPSMDLSNYQVVYPGDFVLNNQQAWRGSVGVSGHKGIISPAYIVLNIGDALNAGYANYLFRSGVMVAQYVAASRGVGDIQRQLYWPYLRKAYVNIPPPDEQAAIVRYLDYVDRRIRKYIRAKKKLIALLNEQKQAIIHRAVTRGLDPNVKMKPSGVEWLGEVPAHWEVKPAKFFFQESDERSTTGKEELLSVSHLTGVTPRSQKNVTMFMAESHVGHKVCRPGDLAINTMWAWMAALGVSAHYGIVSPAYGVYRPFANSSLSSAFADLLLRTRPYVSEYTCRSTGIQSSRLRLYPEQFLKVKVICPPLAEQEQIVEWVIAENSAAEKTITRIDREIALLQEYRTRLIADVVTGKLDVREAAANLPAELPDDAPQDLDPEGVETLNDDEVPPEEVA